MKKIAFLILSMSAVCTLTAQAETDTVIVKKRPKVVYEDSSAFNRIDKSFNLNLQAFGVGPMGVSAPGGTAGFFLTPDSLLQLEVMNGHNSFSILSDYDVKAKSFGVHYKQFVGNSFYFRVGADYTQMKVNYDYTSIISSSDYWAKRDLEGNVVSTSILIGNQWQWDNFTLGCDWIGLSIPVTQDISKRTASRSDSSSFDDDYDQRRLDEDEDRYFKKVVGQGLRFYLGASF